MRRKFNKADLIDLANLEETMEFDYPWEIKTTTKTIEFDAKTKILELDKIIREAHLKKKNIPYRHKVSKAIKLLKPLEKSKNERASKRVKEIIDILEELL